MLPMIGHGYGPGGSGGDFDLKCLRMRKRRGRRRRIRGKTLLPSVTVVRAMGLCCEKMACEEGFL